MKIYAVTATTDHALANEVDPDSYFGKSTSMLDPTRVNVFDNSNHNECVVSAYQYLYTTHVLESDVIVFMHDDLKIHVDYWSGAVEELFMLNPKCAIIGLGGATGIGSVDLYKVPYKLNDLARIGYGSNQTDWPTHGIHITTPRRVAVVDGFFMAIRTSFLRSIGGWPVKHLNFHCYDLWMCLEAHRRGLEVWTLPISCTHHGGGTSTKQAYMDYLAGIGRTAEQDHALPHRKLYDSFRDVLPLRITP